MEYSNPLTGWRSWDAKNGVRLNLAEMKALGAELKKAKRARVRVGVLGSKADRFNIDTSTSESDPLNNPTLGLIHEFGTKGEVVTVASGETGPHAQKDIQIRTRAPIPARSFLRMPLTLELPREIEKIGRAVWRKIILKKGIVAALGDLGTTARNVVDKAFETGGFGQWAPNSPVTIRRKGSSKPLIDTAQLRKSVTYEVTGVKQ